MEIREQLIPSGTKRRSGKKMDKVVFIVLHDTGNPNSTALNNVVYYTNSRNEIEASAHIFVDDKEAIMCIPCLTNPEKAWHVLYSKPYDNQIYGYDANDCAIGVELCYFPNDKTRSLKAYQNYVEVVAYLMNYHKIGVKCSGHEQLDPKRKTDPSNALRYIGKTYNDLIDDIKVAYDKLQGKDNDLIQAVSVLNNKGVINTPEAWNNVNTMNMKYVKDLIKNIALSMIDYEDCIEILKSHGMVSDDKLWLDKKYNTNHVRSLIIKAVKE